MISRNNSASFFPLLILILELAAARLAFSDNHYRIPVFDFQSSLGDVYRGKIKENENLVQISPEIRIIEGTGPVCNYIIEKSLAVDDESSSNNDISSTNSNNDSRTIIGSVGSPAAVDQSGDHVPFYVNVLSKETGHAEVRVKGGRRGSRVLDCSDKPYKFTVRAQRCSDNSLSDRAELEIIVDDTNNHEPVFTNQWYTADVEEGRLYDRIVQLEAKDEDCGHPYGEICRYEITNNAKSFAVTPTGVLKNVEPLNHSVSATHLVTVVAHDCGMRRSKPALVTVRVGPKIPRCRSGLSEYPSRSIYYAGQGALDLFPGANFRTCEALDDCRRLKSIEAKISLTSDFQQQNDRRTCDRENLSIDAQRKVCGADPNTVELLPSSKKVHLENEDDVNKQDENNNNNAINDVIAASSTEEVYIFDGRDNSVVVPESTFQPRLMNKFTLSFWMKHEKPPKDASRQHQKENIVCLSDDHAMNRHHFAVYVKNCKLEVLFRHESSGKSQKNPPKKKSSTTINAEERFEPAEWRWHLDETCDGSWHFYTLNVQFPEIDLLVDGAKISTKGNYPEILEDWPMHPHHLNMRLVVGACWHGAQNTTAQHFRGYLSGVTILPEKLERPTVVECLLKCRERLEFFGLEQLKMGEEAYFNKEMSELTLKAANVPDFAEMLRKIAYLNSRTDPTLGDRFITMTATASCEGKAIPIAFPVVETRLTVKMADVKKLMLKSGQLIISQSESDVQNHGVSIFPDLNVFVIIDRLQEKSGDDADYYLDYCKIKSEPRLDKSREFFSSAALLMEKLPKLDFEHVNDGLLLKGKESAKNYQSVLREIRYFNSRPGDFSKRVFVLRCGMMDGRLLSNEFIVTLNIEKNAKKIAETSAELGQKIHQELSAIGAAENANYSAWSGNNASDGQPGPHHQHSSSEEQRQHHYLASKPNNNAAYSAPSHNNKKILKFESSERQQNLGLGGEPQPAMMKISKLEAFAPQVKVVHDAVGYDGFGPALQTGPGGAIAVVVVVCVGFLLLLVVMGILKVRSTHRRLLKSRRRQSSAERDDVIGGGGGGILGAAAGHPGAATELAWDDSGMNITVNPADDQAIVSEEERTRTGAADDNYSEMNSDEDSCQEDDFSEEEDDDDDDHVLPHVVAASGVNGRNNGGGRRGSAAANGNGGGHQRLASGGRNGNGLNGGGGGLEWDDSTLDNRSGHGGSRGGRTYRV